MSAPGIGHLLMGEMDMPGVDYIHLRVGGAIPGPTVEKDASFQVGYILSMSIDTDLQFHIFPNRKTNRLHNN